MELLREVKGFRRDSGNFHHRPCFVCGAKTKFPNGVLVQPQCPTCCGKMSYITRHAAIDMYGVRESELDRLPHFLAHDSSFIGN